jgi:general stress protein YciG
MNDEPDYPVKKPRGFAAMDPEKQREIASRGGKGISNDRRYYSINVEAAREAGRKGAANKQANYLARKAAKEDEDGKQITRR